MVAAVLGVLIGRTIRLRDRQLADETVTEDEPTLPYIPTQKSGDRWRRGQ